MPDEPKPAPRHMGDHVPDVVLEELLAAFSASADDTDAKAVDFDDPAIDKMLGLSESTPLPAPAPIGDASEGVVRIIPKGEQAAAEPNRPTIVIGNDDDDRLDPIYLDEESSQRLREVHAGEHAGERAGDLDDAAGRSTIVIKDLDEAGGIEALPARSSGSMDPRVRARRIAVRRAKGRKRLIWVAVAAAIVLVLVGAVAVLASSLFDVRTVDVQGAVYTDPAQLAQILDDVRGDAILLVDTRKVERQLERIPWVESARVSTHFPHTLFVDIRERAAIATFAGSDGRYRVIDRDGRVLDVLDGVPIDYMLITGANPDVEQGQFAGRPFASAAQLTIALPAEIRSLTESVGVDATAGDLSLLLRTGAKNGTMEGTRVQLGPASDLSSKLVRLLTEVRGGLDNVCALDVSTSEISRTTCT